MQVEAVEGVEEVEEEELCEELEDELDDELDDPRQQEVYWYCRTMMGRPHWPCWTSSPVVKPVGGWIVNVSIRPEFLFRYWAVPHCQFTRSA